MNTVPKNEIATGTGIWQYRHWYSLVVADWLSELPAGNVLEIGADTARVVPESMTMDIRGYADVMHDVTDTPWPIADKQFDVTLALEVWEHLHHHELQAFRELRRTSKRAILSLPYMWQADATELADHVGIDIAKINEWTGNTKPERVVVVYPEHCSPHIILEFVFV